MNEKGFEGLKVWQKAYVLMIDIHKKLTPLFPKDERFDLVSQIRRSSKSVPANIAESHGRYYYGIMSDFVTMRAVLWMKL